MKRNQNYAPYLAAAAGVAIAVAALGFSGCESGDGGSAPAGTSTVQGNVVSFSAGSAFYAPSVPRRGLARAIIHDLGNLLVPAAEAAAPGVTIKMMGTDLQTTTADDGSFVMSGVPAGNHQMAFSMNGMTAVMDVNVPDNATVHMDDISVNGNNVHVGHMSTEMHGSGNSSGPMMNP